MTEDYFDLPNDRETFAEWCQEIDSFDTNLYERLKTTGITENPHKTFGAGESVLDGKFAAG